ncbi:hypothetical protein VTN00DRAFT_1405 [Thermoascus crustaceus]|uniref:uncharacterized protein n=1 Tax=Thermoascus crustaceus TaxID=5088 RepID=UPI003743A8F9
MQRLKRLPFLQKSGFCTSLLASSRAGHDIMRRVRLEPPQNPWLQPSLTETQTVRSNSITQNIYILEDRNTRTFQTLSPPSGLGTVVTMIISYNHPVRLFASIVYPRSPQHVETEKGTGKGRNTSRQANPNYSREKTERRPSAFWKNTEAWFAFNPRRSDSTQEKHMTEQKNRTNTTPISTEETPELMSETGMTDDAASCQQKIPMKENFRRIDPVRKATDIDLCSGSAPFSSKSPAAIMLQASQK